MGLSEYQRKRHFERTPEPPGQQAATEGKSFVVQLHQARRLHYDFRLELDGVLKSWAIPKGPSLDPSVKRLAMHVEDHPVAYGAFEGIIPAGEYGGGTVMLWDRGQWEPVGDPHEDYRAGKLKFTLHGDKLRGRWMLVRMHGGSGRDRERQWLLLKERDEVARPMEQGDILKDLPNSVATGRGLEQIAADRDWVWNAADATPVGRRHSVRPPAVARSNEPKAATAALGRRPRRLEVRFTHPHKVMYPEQGITKLELAHYYMAVASWMLPHLADRPLVLVRCPEGREKHCFFQKHPARGTPDTLRRVPVREKNKVEQYVVVDDLAGLVSLAQIGALEIHAWGSRADRLERPDRLIFDLDPDPLVPWSSVVQSARQVRDFLQEIGLESFVKTTGGNRILRRS